MRLNKLVLLLCMLIAAMLVNLQLGSYPVAPSAMLAVVTGSATPQEELVLLGIRLPRLVVVVLAGLALSLSGAALQAISRNSLADPGILGLTSGAGLMVILQMYLLQEGDTPLILSRPAAASIGAFAAAILVYLLARKRGSLDPDRLLLCGIAVNAGLTAATLVLSMRLDRRLYDAAVLWISGQASGKGWPDVVMMLPWLALLVPLVLSQAKALDILGLGDETARSVGLPVEPRRMLLLLAVVGLAGTAVATVGGVGFVGLLGPHIARGLVGPRHRLLLPASALAGACLLAVADAIARTLLAPVELPLGIVVALLGAPYFLYLMTTTARW